MANSQRNFALFLNGFCFIVFFIIFGNCGAWDPDNCPTFCECFSHYGLRWAECVGHRLYSIQTGVNDAVQALDVSNNSISSLGDYELREAGLSGLKFLNLSSNAISEIGLSAFVGLTDLRVLDLARNHLYYILPITFVDSKKLEVLDISGNNLNQHVPHLQSTSLASLGLRGCRISHLPSNTFEELPKLRVLDLSNNIMIQLKPEVVKKIPNLAILMLERNPWICNSEMFELQDHLRAAKVIFKKVCNEKKLPSSKKGPKMFEKMIALDTVTPSRVAATSGQLLAGIKNWRNSWKVKSSPEPCPPQVMSETKSENIFGIDLTTVSPFWFVASGFILGAAVSTVATYFWLTKTISRSLANLRNRTIRGEPAEIANQRENLLQHLWQSNDDGSSSSRSTSTCPGTPPPPYRDVMLYASRYPRPNIHTINLNNSSGRNHQQVNS